MTAAVVPAGERRPVVRRAWGTVIGAAVVVSLVRPGAWAVGLAGFLARGGVVLLALPIVVLPTPTGLQNALGGPVSSMVFGALSPALVALLVGVAVAAIVAVAVGSWVAAWAERQGIALALEAAADEGLVVPSADLRRAPGVGRVAVLRLLGLAPPVLALLLGWRRIYDVTYHELILPGDLATALPVRVIGDIPWVIIGVLVAWAVGDAAASTGIRRLVLERRPVLEAWLLGWADLVRRPLRVLGTGLAGVGLAIALVAPALLAAAVGWSRVQAAMLDGREPLAALIVVATWVTTWLGSLVLAGVGAAIRNAAWTLELPTPA